MKDGFIKAAAITPKVKVADTYYNTAQIISCMDKAESAGAKLLVFPELCITGYTCGDLFLQETLLFKAQEALFKIAEYTKDKDYIVFVGLPIEHVGKLYNVAAAVNRGRILGFIPKKNIPNYSEFYECRYFEPGRPETVYVALNNGVRVPMSTNILLKCRQMRQLKISAELCEDLWAPNPPSISHALAGATVIVNISASDEITGKDVYRRELIAGQSARLICAYIYSSAGEGESTQDVVYSGHDIISENGIILSESERFGTGMIFNDIDVQRLSEERRRMSTFSVFDADHFMVDFDLDVTATPLTRKIDPMPFVPGKMSDRSRRCEDIFMIQSMGLKKRLEHTNSRSAVVGVSGGLDSALALLVTVQAFDLLGWNRKGIIGVTMPGFGTTDRTYLNAVRLIKELGATFREIPISAAVRQHFEDIGQDENVRDVTYENAQARERTQILMDLANKEGGLVVGTGDMSELALGWATYNADHMSMYGVNASVPKTLVRHLVNYYADTHADSMVQTVLTDVLETPVSPELLPPKDGKISQKTEDIVGPYELHDFFLYYMLRFGCRPSKIYRLAGYAFKGLYDDKTILKWLSVFTRRFFAQQYKRSCLPDGPKVGTVAVSPRGDLRMPSDACADIWLAEIRELEAKA